MREVGREKGRDLRGWDLRTERTERERERPDTKTHHVCLHLQTYIYVWTYR